MDLAAMGKKPLLIPARTDGAGVPGRRMAELGYLPFQHQSSINLERGIRAASECRVSGQEMKERVEAAVEAYWRASPKQLLIVAS